MPFPPFIARDWTELADQQHSSTDWPGQPTPCWAEVQPGAYCNVWTDDELGLCPPHKASLLPRPPGRGASPPTVAAPPPREVAGES